MKSISVLSIVNIFLNLFKCVTLVHIVVWDCMGTISTRISLWPLMEALTDKSHNITHISPFKISDSSSNSKIRTINPKNLIEMYAANWNDSINRFKFRESPFGIPRQWYDNRDFALIGCRALYADEEFISWATSPETRVDMVIMEMSVNECAYGFVHLWKSKLIVYSTTSVMTWFHDAYGLPDESSSISDILFAYPSSPKNQMNFWQRFLNTMNTILNTVTREWFYLPKMEEIARKGLGFQKMPSFKEIEKNTSLIFLATHFSFETPRSLPPNFVSIGGSVVKKQILPLPIKMAEFIDSATEGFIYISLGTIAEFTHLDIGIQIEFINALKAFPNVKFIWKSKYQINATTIPENIMLTKFAPQQSLLSHRNIKAFITHAGMGSTAEAIHFSVPVICIPVLMDQDFNANAIVERGAGIKLEILTLKTHELKHAISQMLYDKGYRQAMTKLTRLFKDRPRPPLEEAVWWVEYILRHDNIHELLTPPSAHQPWWKRRLLDVWIVTFTIAIAVIITLLFLISGAVCVIAALLCPDRHLPPRHKRKAKVIVRSGLLRLSNIVRKTIRKLRSRSKQRL